jgi:hypothetical protein
MYPATSLAVIRVQLLDEGVGIVGDAGRDRPRLPPFVDI